MKQRAKKSITFKLCCGKESAIMHTTEYNHVHVEELCKDKDLLCKGTGTFVFA